MKYLIPILLFCLILLPAVVHAKPGKVLRIATQDSAPYAMPDAHSGLGVDIVREALALEGYTMLLVLMPALRMGEALITGKIDGAFPVRSGVHGASIFYSDSHMTYRNVVASLAGQHATINGIPDLAKYKVEAFLGASKWLSKEYRTMAKEHGEYTEQNDQQAQVCSFFARRDRVIILEQHIFSYYAHQKRCNPLHQTYVIHPLFDPVHLGVAFSDKHIRNDFNNGLKKLKESGRYDAILKRYISTDS